MSEVYNPEADDLADLESLEVEARRLASRRDQASTDEDREVIERQLQETESRIDRLRERLKRRR